MGSSAKREASRRMDGWGVGNKPSPRACACSWLVQTTRAPQRNELWAPVRRRFYGRKLGACSASRFPSTDGSAQRQGRAPRNSERGKIQGKVTSCASKRHLGGGSSCSRITTDETRMIGRGEENCGPRRPTGRHFTRVLGSSSVLHSSSGLAGRLPHWQAAPRFRPVPHRRNRSADGGARRRPQ